jgi:hypothetical protein
MIMQIWQLQGRTAKAEWVVKEVLMNHVTTRVLFALSALAFAIPARAETAPAVPEARPAGSSFGYEPHVSAMVGLTQWILFRGGNVALEYKTGRFAFEFSHGQGLDLNQLPGVALTADERAAGVHVYVPWTTGFGVGYRFTENLHVLVELKAHRYDVASRDRSAEVDYTTFSIGPSVFYTVYLYKGLFLEPNVRFWPNVASTLPANRTSFLDTDGTVREHKAHDFGLFANMNLGWTI